MIDRDPMTEDPVDKWVHAIAIRLYRSHQTLLSFFPESERSSCMAVFCCSFGVIIALLDHQTSSVSLRSLYVVPVILAAMASSHICAASVSIFIATAHVVSLRAAFALSGEEFSLLWNFIPPLIAYLFLMETVRLLNRAMFDALACNDALLERVVFMEIEKDRKMRGE